MSQKIKRANKAKAKQAARAETRATHSKYRAKKWKEATEQAPRTREERAPS